MQIVRNCISSPQINWRINYAGIIVGCDVGAFRPAGERNRGEGCRLIDIDGNHLLDFTGNHSSLVHGYGHPVIMDAVEQQL